MGANGRLVHGGARRQAMGQASSGYKNPGLLTIVRSPECMGPPRTRPSRVGHTGSLSQLSVTLIPIRQQ